MYWSLVVRQYPSLRARPYLRLERRLRSGQRLYSVMISAWPDDTDLTFPSGEVLPVKDTKAMAKAGADAPEATYGIIDDDDKAPTRKGKFGRGFSDVVISTFQGTNAKFRHSQRIDVIYARSKKAKAVLRVMITQRSRTPIDDGMLTWVFAQLKPAKKK